MKKIKPIETAALSFIDDKPFSTTFNDTYFSSVGAIAEKTHVFLNGNQLPRRFKRLDNDASFVIAELGFGLGINFLLTWRLWLEQAPSNSQLHFISSELNPLIQKDLTQVLQLFPELSFYADQLLADYPTLTPGAHRLNFGTVSLTLLLGDAGDMLKQWVCDGDYDLQTQLRSFTVDCWYFDGFSPKKNPALWENELLKTVRLLSDSHTTLASYSVAGSFKRALDSNGFSYRKEKGIGNKREFLCGKIIESDLNIHSHQKGYSPWHVVKNDCPLKCDQTIAVVGAGLAGCLMAHRLAQRGFSVTLFEKEAGVATKGSGNEMGLVHFKLSPYHTPLNDFMLSAFLYALRFYRSIEGIDCMQGIADLLSPETFEKKQALFLELATAYPELIQFLSKDGSEKIAGIPLSKPTMHWPKALMLSPIKLCRYLSDHKKIAIVSKRFYVDDDNQFDKVIFCCGTATTNHQLCEYLPLDKVSGMVSYVNKTQKSNALRIGLSDKGYLTPSNSCGVHVLGGSYHVHEIAKAHNEHLAIAVNISDEFSNFNAQPFSYKCGERAKSYDYLPYIGVLPQRKAFNLLYAPFTKDKHIRIDKPAPYDLKHYVLTGFGSHGLTTIPLAVEIVLSQLFNEPSPVCQSLLKAVSPARPLIRALERGR